MKPKSVYPSLTDEIARANMTYVALANIVGINLTTHGQSSAEEGLFCLDEALKISELFPNTDLKSLF